MGRYNSGLSQREQEILEGFGEEGLTHLRRTYITNLGDYKARIIGTRAEDIFFFLQALQQGSMPVSGNKTMGKVVENGLYLRANPESSYVRGINDTRLHDMLEEDVSWDDSTNRVVKRYSDVAIKNPVVREVSRYVDVGRELKRKSKKFRSGYSPKFAIDFENFFDLLCKEMLNNDSDFNQPHRYPMLNLVGSYVPAGERAALLAYFKGLKGRQGIIVGFNEKLGAYKRIHSDKLEVPDLVFRVPKKEVDLDCIEGFEVLGDFEEKIVKNLLKE